MITIFCSTEREYNYLPDSVTIHADVIYVAGTVVHSKLAHFEVGEPLVATPEPPAPDPGPRKRAYCGDCGERFNQRAPKYGAYDEYTGARIKSSCNVCVTPNCPSKGVEK